MTKITNREAREYVQKRKPFTGNNLFGNVVIGLDKKLRYVVYSYGKHWPLFIYDNQTERWYENKSKYGVTTSKHHGQAHPLCTTTPLHVDDMVKVVAGGITAIIEGVAA